MRSDNDVDRLRTTVRRASAVLALLVSLTLGTDGATAQADEPCEPVEVP